MNELGIAVDADVRLHAEVPLIALLGLVHVRIELMLGFLGRERGIDDAGADDRSGRSLESLRLQVPMYFLK